MTEQTIKKCHTCQKVSEELLRCSKCKMVQYCDQNCQRTDWKSHKAVCGTQVRNPERSEKDITKVEEIPQPQPQQDKQDSLSEFGKLEHLGTGNFSMIYRTKSMKDGKIYAIKQVEKAKAQRLRKQADLFMEKHCLSRLKECDYVVKLHKTFQDEFSLYFQMDCPEKGELWELSKTFGVPSQALFKYYASHIVKAVSVLHNEYQIVHRDLKPENILLNADNEIKLIDFGTAKDLSRPDIKGSGNGAKGKKVFDHYVGTPNYMAPQCIHNKASEKVSDVYSLSGVLYFLKVGSPPFSGASEYLVFTKSLETQFLKCQLFSQDLYDLLIKMNEKDMTKRLTIDQVMIHPYFGDLDFNHLPTFKEAFQQETLIDKYLSGKCSELQTKFGEKIKDTLQERKKLLETEIRENLNQAVEQFKGTEEERKVIEERVKIMEIQCQCMLNIQDDLNIGFTEILKEKMQ